MSLYLADKKNEKESDVMKRIYEPRKTYSGFLGSI